MLCGVGRLSPRSLLATAIFFPTALVTFQITHPSLETAACSPGVACYQSSFPSLRDAGALGMLALAALGFVALQSRQRTDEAESPKTIDPINTSHALAGLLFALGLLTSGMASPSKVQSFFAISPTSLHHWDPSLALVLVFGVLPNMMSIRRRGLEEPPRLAPRFSLPTKTMADVGWRFVVGAVAFGVSWGATGTCPGPAVVRAVVQPWWGGLWMLGFWVGGLGGL